MNAAIETADRIVVGTDGSQRASKAVEWAADRAVARKLPLVVFHVIAEVPLPRRTGAAAAISQGFDYVAEYKSRTKKKLDGLVADLRSRYPGLVVDGHVVTGNPSYVLAQASKDAAQVVVGARGQGAPLSVRLLGGVSDAVTAHAHGPVAVIGDGAIENPGGPVVVGVDESEAAKTAIDLAFDAADVRGVPLIAINAWDFGPYDAYNAEIWERTAADITAGLTEMVNELLADAQAKHPEVSVQVQVVRGRPGTALVDASKQAGLVVVGSRGRGGFTGLLLGSTSKHVLRESHCPVIVTRG